MLKVPPTGQVRDIRSALRRRPDRIRDKKVVDLRAYRGANVIRFPRPSGPASTA